MFKTAGGGRGFLSFGRCLGDCGHGFSLAHRKGGVNRQLSYVVKSRPFPSLKVTCFILFWVYIYICLCDYLEDESTNTIYPTDIIAPAIARDMPTWCEISPS